MVAAGSLVVLGFGGAALAEGSDDVRPRAVASPSVTASEAVDPSDLPSSSGSVSSTVPGFTAGEARAIALRAVPGGVIESVERDTEHGRIVWEIDVIAGGVEHDIEVDAATGEITRHRTGDDRDEKGRADDSGRARSEDSGRDDRVDDKSRDDAGDDHGGGDD